jgi:hypothetical protein
MVGAGSWEPLAIACREACAKGRQASYHTTDGAGMGVGTK